MTTYYLATCQDCTPVLAQPFTDMSESVTWAKAHISATGHKVSYGIETRGGGDGVRLSDPAPIPFCGVPGHPHGAHGGHPEPPDSVPVPVLQALASAWEDQSAIQRGNAAHMTGNRAVEYESRGLALAKCARMLREAITHEGQG